MIGVFPRSAIKEPNVGDVLTQLLREKRKREKKKKRPRVIIEEEAVQTYEALEKVIESYRESKPLPELPHIPLINWDRAFKLLAESIRLERQARDENDLLELLAISDAGGEIN